MERRRKYPSHRSTQNSRLRVVVADRQKALRISIPSVRSLVWCCFQSLGGVPFPGCTVSVYFVDITTSGEMHAQFFNDPTPTDCMTFPLGHPFFGESVICPEVALERAPSNPHKEASLYLIHSILHLMGYRDIDKEERATMRAEERRLLQQAEQTECLLTP